MHQEEDQMGYERDSRSYGRGRGWGDRSQAYGRGERRDWRERENEQGRGREWDRDDDDRGFFERAGDEVRSWFGDEEAERRRRYDERADRDWDRDDWNRRDWNERSQRQGGEWRRQQGSGREGGYPGYREPVQTYTGARRSRQDEWRGGGQDPHYRSWRERQMEAFDRDYDEYRRENESRFSQDFGSWRQNRETQRQSLRQVRPHQEVVGSDGQHVGTVDKLRGDRIILTKSDSEAGGHHHSIPCSWIRNVGDKVELNKTATEAQTAWKDEERSLFWNEEQRDDRDEGPHILNRSFSGTYRE
jgi:hypothetical protein